MSFLIETILRGGIGPALVSLAVLGLGRRFGSETAASRHAPGWAVGLAFLLGYLLLPSEPIVPESHWHWLPYLGLLAVPVGAVTATEAGLERIRGALTLGLAIFAAWLLVPDWQEIAPHRHSYLLAVAGLLFIAVILLDLSVVGARETSVLALFGATALAGALVLAQSGSMKFAHLGGALAAGTLGCAIGTACGLSKPLIRGLVPVFVVLLGGLMFTGYVQSFSDVPAASYLLVFCAPLGLGVAKWPPLRKTSKKWATLPASAIVLVTLTVAVTLALVAENPWS